MASLGTALRRCPGHGGNNRDRDRGQMTSAVTAMVAAVLFAAMTRVLVGMVVRDDRLDRTEVAEKDSGVGHLLQLSRKKRDEKKCDRRPHPARMSQMSNRGNSPRRIGGVEPSQGLTTWHQETIVML